MPALIAPQAPTQPATATEYNTGAVGSAVGYLSRRVYVNAASTRIGTTFLGVVCQAAVTWNTAADIPAGTWFDIEEAGAGGGGAGAGGIAGDGVAGAGGGGGGRQSYRLSRAQVVAMLPVVISAGLGGTAGIGKTNVNLVTTIAATSGGVGGGSAFGIYTAGGGSGGVAGAGQHGGCGGGIGTAAMPPSTTSPSRGGAPASVVGIPGSFLEGAGHAGTSAGTDCGGMPAVYGGASGGIVPGVSNTVGGAGGRSVFGGGGGGGGRSVGAAAGGQAGSAGGGRWTGSTTTGGGGAGGPGSVALGIAPAPGSAGADSTDYFANGDGGGGGGSNENASGSPVPPTLIAGAGGAGGFPGGAGGGGGPPRLGSFSGRTFVHGDGGPGADGMVMVTASI
jgi:hypothetical protein